MYGEKDLRNLAMEYKQESSRMFSENRIDEAIMLMYNALQLFRKLGDESEQAQLLDKMGVLYGLIGNDENTIQCLIEGLEIAIRLKDYMLIARIYNNIGTRYQMLHDNISAIEYFVKADNALTILEEEQDESFNEMSLVINLNLGISHCEISEYEKAEYYTKKARSFSEEDENNPYYYVMLILECRLNWELGREEFVEENIEDILDGIISQSNISDFEQKVYELTKLFYRMEDYERWYMILKTFSQYAKKQNNVYFSMVSMELWSRYYRAKGDISNYQRVCADHMELFLKQRRITEKERSNSISMSIELRESMMNDADAQKVLNLHENEDNENGPAFERDYNIFYERYNKNMEDEERLESYYKDADSQEQWLMNLKQRTFRIQELFDENELLISRYITPLLSGKTELTVENASVICDNIWSMYNEGKTDYLVIVEMAEFMVDFLKEHECVEDHIKMLIILSNSYCAIEGHVYYGKAVEYHNELKLYRDNFDIIKNVEIQKKLCYEYFFTGILLYVHDGTTLSQCMEEIDKSVLFFYDKEIDKKFNLSRQVAEWFVDQFTTRIIAGNILDVYEIAPEDEVFRDAHHSLKDIYVRWQNSGREIYEMDVLLYMSFHKMEWLRGKISILEYFEVLNDFYQKNYSDMMMKKSDNDRLTSEAELIRHNEMLEENIDRRLFNMILNYVPELLKISKMLEDEGNEIEAKTVVSLLQDYLAYIKDVPKLGNELFATRVFYDSFAKVLERVPDWIDIFDLVYQVIIERDVDLTIHSNMVSEIAKLIVEMVYRNDPSLFIGAMDMKTEEEAVNHWPDVINYISNAGRIHDIGKVEINHITKKQTRKLNDLEFGVIQRHPIYGARMIRKANLLEQFVPIIKGHHKNYDDKGGYPFDYDYTKQPDGILVNIIQLSDCLDAATDSIGRVYSKTKTIDDVLEEFEMDMGTRYNPELVKLMLKDERFRSELKELTTTGRVEICYDVYNSYLAEYEE